MPCPYEPDVYHACVATRKQSGVRADHAANAHNQEAGATNRLGVFQAIQSAAPWAISGLGGFPGPRGVVACVVWHTKRPPSVLGGKLVLRARRADQTVRRLPRHAGRLFQRKGHRSEMPLLPRRINSSRDADVHSSANFVRNVDSFEGDHPEFAALRTGRGDPGTIQLNHYRHLQPNLLGPNGARVQMVCNDCHRSAADANLAWPYGDSQSEAGAVKATPLDAAKSNLMISAKSRAYMAPATYAHACAACHSLQFDKRLADAVPHDSPETIHPFIAAKLQAYIATHPGELRVPRDPSRDLPENPIPADYRLLTPSQWVVERTAEAEQLLWRKTCKQCHTLVFADGAALPKVAPSNITARYMPHAKFDHSQHGLVSCTSCHANATTSQQSSDLLLPGIATCRSCHHSGAEAAESRCFECHTYHDPAQHKPAHSDISLADLVSPRMPAPDAQ